jgi:hypothetical protein
MIITMIFNMSTSYFHKFSFHYFEDNDEIDLRVRYTLFSQFYNSIGARVKSW